MWTPITSKKPASGGWLTLVREDLAYRYEGLKLPSSLENFDRIHVDGGGGCTLRMDWETTRFRGVAKK
jgi:hypothetical protein